MRLGWLTDIHLNFVDSDVRCALYDLVCQRCDGVVITGDIGESDSVVQYLSEMAGELARPIYFVLGNHDFYRGSIARTRELVTQAASRSDHLHYLTAGGVIELTSKTALIGHDGWADDRLGDFAASEVILNDFLLIDELRMWRSNHDLDKDALRPILQTLADEAACQLKTSLAAAAAEHSRVIVATHVPPFRQSMWGQTLFFVSCVS